VTASPEGWPSDSPVRYRRLQPSRGMAARPANRTHSRPFRVFSGRGSGANRNRRERTEYQLRCRSDIRCRSRRRHREIRAVSSAVPVPAGKPTSPRIGRPVTFVMVVRRRSWIARFSPPIFKVFRYTRLAPRDGSSGFPIPGLTREWATDVPRAARHRCDSAVSVWPKDNLRHPSSSTLNPTVRRSVPSVPSGPSSKGLASSRASEPPLSLWRD